MGIEIPEQSEDEVVAKTKAWLSRRPNVYGQSVIKDVELEELSDKPVNRWARKIINAAQAEKDLDYISETEEKHGSSLDPYKTEPSSITDIDDILDIRNIMVDGKRVKMVTLQEPELPSKERRGKPEEVAEHRWKEEAIEGFMEDEPYPKGDPIWIDASLETLRDPSYLNIGQDLIDAEMSKEDKRKCAIYSMLRQRDGWEPSHMIRYNEHVGYTGIIFDFPEREES